MINTNLWGYLHIMFDIMNILPNLENKMMKCTYLNLPINKLNNNIFS